MATFINLHHFIKSFVWNSHYPPPLVSNKRVASLFIGVATLAFSSCEQAQVMPHTVQPDITVSTQGHLVLKNRAVFEALVNKAGEKPESVKLTEPIVGFGNRYQGFHSLREKQDAATAASSEGDLARGAGETATLVEDDYFASLLSADGTIQIDNNIYKVDVAKNRVYYIPEASNLYAELIEDNPNNPAVRYFSTEVEVLDLIDEGIEGISSSGIEEEPTESERCGESMAAGAEAKVIEPYNGTNYRLDCKIVYQKLGIYFSIISKVNSQYKSYPNPLWIPYKSPSLINEMSGVFKPRCWGERSAVRSTSPANSNNSSTTGFRIWESTRGLTYYDITTEFQASGSRVVSLRIRN